MADASCFTFLRSEQAAHGGFRKNLPGSSPSDWRFRVTWRRIGHAKPEVFTRCLPLPAHRPHYPMLIFDGSLIGEGAVHHATTTGVAFIGVHYSRGFAFFSIRGKDVYGANLHACVAAVTHIFIYNYRLAAGRYARIGIYGIRFYLCHLILPCIVYYIILLLWRVVSFIVLLNGAPEVHRQFPNFDSTILLLYGEELMPLGRVVLLVI